MGTEAEKLRIMDISKSKGEKEGWIMGKVMVKAKIKIARGINIEVMGREAEVECVVEAPGTQILLGQMPLEAMDLIVDPKTGKLMPRLESPDMPLIDILRVEV